MTRKTIITKIKKHRTHLISLGVKRLAIFGSVARGEAVKQIPEDVREKFPQIKWRK